MFANNHFGKMRHTLTGPRTYTTVLLLTVHTVPFPYTISVSYDFPGLLCYEIRFGESSNVAISSSRTVFTRFGSTSDIKTKALKFEVTPEKENTR